MDPLIVTPKQAKNPTRPGIAQMIARLHSHSLSESLTAVEKETMVHSADEMVDMWTHIKDLRRELVNMKNAALKMGSGLKHSATDFCDTEQNSSFQA